MKQTVYVGFDTSNYTTSAAVCSEEGRVLANIRVPLPVREGERGLRQSDAVFAHTKNLPIVCEELRAAVAGRRVLAVGVSTRPRWSENSYMPCFLAGRAAAEAFAAGLELPVREFSHQDGHVMAALYSSGEMNSLLSGRFAAFHVSGGTTDLLLCEPETERFKITVIGGSADLHAGQAIDRIGVMMGLRFPCGKELEALAAENTQRVPTPKISVRNGVCHFSGLENLAQGLWQKTGDRSLVSAFSLEFCARTLQKLTEHIDSVAAGIPVVYAGGVMSNRYLQSVLSKRPNTYFAEPSFSADNAAGIALLCRRAMMAGEE
ncbi:MAG: peptidase M22 [Ruminococcaceae bacterium]|nr:peptidase M22 [Oscillospiraceae bacterium]